MMCGGVSKSGSPRISETTVWPRAWACRISARIVLTAVGKRRPERREGVMVKGGSVPLFSPEASLEDLRRRESLQLQKVLRRGDECGLRRQADDLALEHAHAVSLRFAPDCIEHAMHRRPLV